MLDFLLFITIIAWHSNKCLASIYLNAIIYQQASIVAKQHKKAGGSLSAPLFALRVFLFIRQPLRWLFFRIQFIVMPTNRVFTDISQMLLVILTISDNVVIKITLPNIFTIFLVAKSFEGRYKMRNRRRLSCRGRRPRRPTFRHKQHNMDMVGHNHVLIYG